MRTSTANGWRVCHLSRGLNWWLRASTDLSQTTTEFSRQTPSVAFDKASYDFSYDFLDSQEKPTETLEGVEIAYGCQMLRWVFERLQGAKNEGIRRLEIDTLMMTLGMEQMLGVKSQTELAKKYGITRAAISARVKSWQKFLGLRTTSTMKSPSACQSYRNSRLRNLTSG